MLETGRLQSIWSHRVRYDWATNTTWSCWQAWFQNAGLWAGLISPCDLCPRAVDIILTLEPRKDYASRISIKIFSDPWNLCFSLNNIITLDAGDLLWQGRPCYNPVVRTSLRHGPGKMLPSEFRFEGTHKLPTCISSTSLVPFEFPPSCYWL